MSRKPIDEVLGELTGSPAPTVCEAQEAAQVARSHNETVTRTADPASRVLDAMGREWAQHTNGSWGAIGSSVVADSAAEIDAKYGPTEVLG